MYHLRTFRDRVKLTQAEMAYELGIKVSIYAMMERGDRKVPRSLYPAMEKLANKYQIVPKQVRPVEVIESPAIMALRVKYEKQSAEDIRMEEVKCEFELYKLEQELKRMKKSFNKGLEVVNMADSQLPEMKDKPELKYAYAALYVKRNRAMKTLERIAKKNPRKIVMQIQALRQQKLLLRAAIEKTPEYWLEFKV